MTLTEYNKKRNFNKTPEPRGTKTTKTTPPQQPIFVIQKHAASHLHYDFRLQIDNTLVSWAVPKGPSTNPKDKRLAMHVEDHPLEYATFEGIIPPGQYGGGTVMLWDHGTYQPLNPDDPDISTQLKNGSLKIQLNGKRLKGAWALIQMKGKKHDGKSWLLIKENDKHTSTKSITDTHTTSVTTNRTMDQIANDTPANSPTWKSNKQTPQKTKPKSNTRKKTTANTPDPDPNTIPNPKTIPHARKAPFPKTFKPQLATLVKSAPDHSEWVHEIKFDGYRFLAHIQNGKAQLYTRNGKDWTHKFPAVAQALSHLPLDNAIIDGELVALDQNGHSRFQLLQNTLHGDADPTLVFYAFDLPYHNNHLLTSATLHHRKTQLQHILSHLPPSHIIRYSQHFTKSGDKVWTQACNMGLEGIISKQLHSAYQQKRAKTWVKVKCDNRQEFVIGGYTPPAGSRTHFGALLVGLHDPQGNLQYAGKVGTGFTDATLREVHNKLTALHRKTSPFTNPPKSAWTRKVQWVTPKLLAEIAYTEITDSGSLRHPSFQGLRQDKDPKQITQETPTPQDHIPTPRQTKSKSKSQSTKSAKTQTSKKATNAPQKTPPKDATRLDDSQPVPPTLTNPQRILYPDTGHTKQDLADYYTAIQDHAFLWMSHRPITLVRCPEGTTKPCFYQRHPKNTNLPGIKPVDIADDNKTEEYIYLDHPAGLHSLVQNSTLEIHGWQCTIHDLDHPDRIIFDIDPDPGVSWDQIIHTAKTLKNILEKCGLVPHAMTTGGKGLHILAPLTPTATWDEVTTFAKTIAQYLETTHPDQYTANMSKKKRKNKIFIDYLRNNKSSSAILPYSPRARANATVATPLAWTEVTTRLNPQNHTIITIPKRLKTSKGNPWKNYEKSRRPLNTQAIIETLKNT